MLGFLSKKKSMVIGADFDTLTATIVELTKKDNQFILSTCATEPLIKKNVQLKELISEDDPNVEILGSNFAEILQGHKFSAKKIISTVPVSNVITKMFSMENIKNEDEIETRVLIEAEQIIPYQMDEVAIDFEVQENVDNLDILIVGCRKQTIDDRENIIKASGRHPLAVDVTGFAMERAYHLIQKKYLTDEQQGGVALIHIDDFFITLNIIRNSKSICIKSSLFGLRQIAEQWLMNKNKTLYEALTYLMTDVADADNFMEKQCSRMIAQQINRLLEQYYSDHNAVLPSRILLSGKLAAIDKLRVNIENFVNIPCSIADPFSMFIIDGQLNQEELKGISHMFFVACGLAMRG